MLLVKPLANQLMKNTIMQNDYQANAFNYTPAVEAHLPGTIAKLNAQEEAKLIDKLMKQLSEQNAVLIAHYYTPEIIQNLAEATRGFVGDSLAMAQFGQRHSARKLIIAGVKFMGETAKILNPEKTVLMPTIAATCSLDLNCPIDQFSAFCEQYPDRTIVVYANTSAEVKARADWVVTSSIALPIIEHLHQRGEKILWASDKYLGAYLQRKTDADMMCWDAGCIVHEEFKASYLLDLKRQYPQAAILAHPESPMPVLDMADMVGSTSQLINAAEKLPHQIFLVATEEGIFYKMREHAPNKRLILAPTGGAGADCRSCGHCPWMKMNTLQAVADTLTDCSNEILLDEEVRQKALVSVQRMIDFAAAHGI